MDKMFGNPRREIDERSRSEEIVASADKRQLVDVAALHENG